MVLAAGVCGVRIADIPLKYSEMHGKELDLSRCSSSDLSVLLQEIPRLCVLDASTVPQSLEQALIFAGFSDSSPDSSGYVMGCEETFARRVPQNLSSLDSETCPLGSDREKVAVDCQLAQFANELKTFKDSIVDVVAKSSVTCPAGIPLSAVEAEWEKSFVAKGLVGMPDFASLSSRFHVKDVIKFLRCIPSLVVNGSGSELVIIRLREPLMKPKSLVMLDEELFCTEKQDPKQPVSILSSVKQHISSSLVSQLLGQVDKQVLELGSHLAKKGLETSPQDLVLIRLQLQQLQTLKAALQAVVNPLPGQAPATGSKDSNSMDSKQTYAALLSQAAQYAMSAISASKRPGHQFASMKAAGGLSGISTAVSSKRSSPVASAQQDLTQDDTRGLLLRVIEKGSISVSSLKDEWKRMYPSLPPIESLIAKFGSPDMKEFLSGNEWNKRIVVFYATLPSPQLKVATADEFLRISREQPVTIASADGAGSPLLSPTSTCSFTSDIVAAESRATEQQELRSNIQRLTELIFRQVRTKQVALIKEKASKGTAEWKQLESVLAAVEESVLARQSSSSRLDSKRPPPIDTTDGSGPSVTPLMKNFVKKASELIQAGSQPVNSSVSISRIVSMWKADASNEASTIDIQRLVQTTPGVRLVGTERCTLTALSSPGALVACVFGCNDASVWASSNEKLMSSVRRFVDPNRTPATGSTAQLNQLSATLFKSIMSGGSKTAKDCASALKVLAAKDPKSIHEIVSSHIGSLKKCDTKDKMEEAAKAFVSSLMEKGKKMSSSSPALPAEGVDKLLSQLHSVTSAYSFPEVAQRYGRDELLAARESMEKAGQLAEAPCAMGLRVQKMTNPRSVKS